MRAQARGDAAHRFAVRRCTAAARSRARPRSRGRAGAAVTSRMDRIPTPNRRRWSGCRTGGTGGDTSHLAALGRDWADPLRADLDARDGLELPSCVSGRGRAWSYTVRRPSLAARWRRPFAQPPLSKLLAARLNGDRAPQCSRSRGVARRRGHRAVMARIFAARGIASAAELDNDLGRTAAMAIAQRHRRGERSGWPARSSAASGCLSSPITTPMAPLPAR